MEYKVYDLSSIVGENSVIELENIIYELSAITEYPKNSSTIEYLYYLKHTKFLHYHYDEGEKADPNKLYLSFICKQRYVDEFKERILKNLQSLYMIYDKYEYEDIEKKIKDDTNDMLKNDTDCYHVFPCAEEIEHLDLDIFDFPVFYSKRHKYLYISTESPVLLNKDVMKLLNKYYKKDVFMRSYFYGRYEDDDYSDYSV